MDVIKVGSRLTTDLQVMLGSDAFVIRGISHPTTDQMAVTSGVPAEAFTKWMSEHANFQPVAKGFIFAIPEEHDLTPKDKVYGYEPLLEAAITDPEQTKLSEQGVDTETQPEAGMVTTVPNPIPTPPATETHDVPAAPPASPPTPPGPPAEMPATDPATFQPGLPQDHPRQDQDLTANKPA